MTHMLLFSETIFYAQWVRGNTVHRVVAKLAPLVNEMLYITFAVMIYTM
jgi:hypothetical protein